MDEREDCDNLRAEVRRVASLLMSAYEEYEYFSMRVSIAIVVTASGQESALDGQEFGKSDSKCRKRRCWVRHEFLRSQRT